MSGLVGLPGSAGPWSGGTVSDRAVCVLAPNPGVSTLDGTNTWVLHEPGGRNAIVVDPGPADLSHLQRIEAAVAARDARVGLVLLTHGHRDHSEGAAGLATRVGCQVRALDPKHRVGEEGLGDGDAIDVDGCEIRVVATPGHSGDSLSFQLVNDHAVLTGDTILGRGTTVVAHPDGRLADYLDSLQRLRDLAASAQLTRILPGHGPTLDDPAAVIEAYLVHRHTRLDQVRAAVAAIRESGNTDVDISEPVVEIVYADVPRSVWPLARLSTRAQLAYLADLL